MANVVCSRSIFIHIPKTGGVWVYKTLAKTGVGRKAGRSPHTTLAELRASSYYSPSLFRFAFVRHPLRWYESYYRYAIGRRAPQVGPGRWANRKNNTEWLTHPHAGVTFTEFLQYVLDEHPGHCTESYWRFVGPPEDEIEFIGRTESLRGDLLRALDQAGETLSRSQRAAILNRPPINVSPRADTSWPVDLRREFLRLEAPTMERFGYD